MNVGRKEGRKERNILDLRDETIWAFALGTEEKHEKHIIQEVIICPLFQPDTPEFMCRVLPLLYSTR
jgi:hypothetical protein